MDLSGWDLLLPDGMLDYFEVASAKKDEAGYRINLVEKEKPPSEFSGDRLRLHGFHEQVTIKDFPLRGKACFLKVKRRRWMNESSSKVVSRDWKLVAKGTRMTKEFASFLKAVHRYQSSKL